MNAPAELAHVGLTDAQQAIRAQGVGASEVYDAIFNPAALWLKKTGRETGEDDALSRLGNAIEPYIIGEYELATGLKVQRKPDTLRRGRMIAHCDGITEHPDDGPIVVECKWRGHRDGWGAEHSADIPPPIMLQVQQQMGLAGARFAHVPVLFLRPPIVRYAIDFDAALFAMLEEAVDRFWRHVESDTPPEVNPDEPHALDVLRALYRGTNGQRIQATRDLEHWRGVLQESTRIKGEYEKAADVAKAHLLRAMGEASELEFADGMLFRRKLVKVKGYTVEPREQIDARLTKPKESSNAE